MWVDAFGYVPDPEVRSTIAKDRALGHGREAPKPAEE